ncbi:DsrE family protein [Sinomonas sp.]|jgi:intracellular sulfur oxidation DsrE/DsrF family protein|uniref:DsrE family protein n=1 Tax=Sinomonas sp. TaxID=1914986 RepID=UPI002FE0715E
MNENPTPGSGLVVHGTGPAPEAWLPAAMRTALNAAADLGEGAAVEIVVQGPAVALLTAAQGPAAQLEDLRAAGIAILACGNSLRSAGIDEGDLAAGVGTVPAAVGHLARRQWDGWAYMRI